MEKNSNDNQRPEKFIPVAEPEIGEKEKEYVNDCLNSTWISSLGKYISQFEGDFARFSGAKYGVAVCNGTVALHLALKALGIGPEEEVIVPDLTFVATPNAVSYTGAKPVLVDSENKTWNMEPKKIEKKITRRTKAIIPVHLYGHPCEMDEIMRIANKHKLFVIEDAAEAHGAEYKGKRVGAFGHVACFSFYGNKIITTGEGGMCVTNDERLAERMTFIKDHAMDYNNKYYHPEIGFNYRMTNVQAAIGLGQLERIDDIIKKKIANARLYNELLSSVKGITTPPATAWAKNVYWMYSILVEDDYGMSRAALAAKLKKNNIDSRPFFHPMHTLPMYRTSERFPVATELARKGLNLPSSTKLTDEDIKRICAVIKNK